MSTEGKIKLKKTDRVHFICALIAALPFHLFLLASFKINGFSSTTMIYLVINIVLFAAMFYFIKFLYKESNTRIILKKIFFFEVLPVIILFFIFMNGKDFNFDSNKYTMENIDKKLMENSDKTVEPKK